MFSWEALAQDQSNFIRFILDQLKTPALDDLLHRAASELVGLTQDPVFDGYASNDRNKVYAQVQALYLAVHKNQPDILWSIEPQDRFTRSMTQFVRSIDEVLAQRQSDCIDTVVLLAALLIKRGLNPILIMLGPESGNAPTHSILGYWLENKHLPAAKCLWSSIIPNLDEISFVEATGMLRGNKKPFVDASAEAAASLPLDARDRISLPPGAEMRLVASRTDVKIFYAIDLRAALLEIAIHYPVIAIMGAKGGVGKTTITTRMAELIAETRANVLIIDFDIENAGSTVFHHDRSIAALPSVKTVFDHFEIHSKLPGYATHSIGSIERDERLWRVTPDYIKEKRLGEIYLLPARPVHSITGTWDVIANIPNNERNNIVRKEVDSIVQRAQMVAEEIDCVIIDCGAGNNPIYSAAFDRADYGFIVAIPDAISSLNISDIMHEHRVRYPNTNLRKIHVVVNRLPKDEKEAAAVKSRWAPHRPIEYVPDDPQLQAHYFQGLLHFDLGYDNFSLAIRNVLARSLQGSDEKLVPDEIDIWIRPWMDQVVTQQLPQRILDSPRFKLETFYLGILTLLAIGTAILLGVYLSFGSDIFPGLESLFQRSTVALIQVDSEEEAAALLARTLDGEDFTLLASTHSTHQETRESGGQLLTAITPGSNSIPGIGELEGLDSCLKQAQNGTVCPTVFAVNNRFYIIKVLRQFSESRLFAAGIFLVSLPLSWFCFMRLNLQLARKRLLHRLISQGADKAWLHSLLQPSDENMTRSVSKRLQKESLKWLRSILEQAIADDKEKELERRTKGFINNKQQ